MLEMGELLGFDPVMTELEDTIKQDNEKLESDIEEIEEEIERIDTEAAQTADKEEQKLLEQKREEYIKQEKELQDILASNEKFINGQDERHEARNLLLKYSWSKQSRRAASNHSRLIWRTNERHGKLGANSKTSTLQDWFKKFASLVLDELKKGLPKFSSTSGGCLDGPFGLIVNVTEVEGVLDQEEVNCEIPEYDDR